MKAERRIYIFRHGRTDWNADGRIQGHLDIPLNDEGRAQARLLSQPLARLGVTGFLSSDLSRAAESAELAMGGQELPFAQDEGLREIFLGKLQGLTSREIVERFGQEFSERVRGRPLEDSDIISLGSESGDQVVARSLDAIRRFILVGNHHSIAVATHGGVVRRLLQHASVDGAFPAPIRNGVIYPLLWIPDEDRWSIAREIQI